MEQNQMTKSMSATLSPAVIQMQDKFALACQTAQSMQLQDNACAAFQAVVVVTQLKQALTDEVMDAVFMPLMNTTIGFRTDHDPNGKKPMAAYSREVVRECLIDAISIGLMPTGNQMNIIAGRMYPTKEGYTALLKKIGCKYIINVGQDQQKPEAAFAEIPCKINYDWNGDKGGYTFVATVKKDSYSSADQLRGKAERRAKKSLYEYLTGCDFGEADDESSAPVAPSREVAFDEEEQPRMTQRQVMEAAAEKNAANWRQKAAEQQTTSKPSF